MKMKRIMFLSASSMMAIGFQYPVQAQTEVEQTSESGDVAAQGVDGSSSYPSGLQEIVVTAQRRSENLQSVPISITVLTGADIADGSIQNGADLTSQVPGLVFARSTASAQPTIRGVGARSGSVGNEGNVAIYLDGVYQAQPFGNLLELRDVEQVEILKGPQVTLYGRNALGGAINVRTRGPSFEPRGEFSASYGSYGYVEGSAFISGPLSGDSLAASLSVSAAQDNGYIENIFLNETVGDFDNQYIRAKLLWNITPDVSFLVDGLYNRSNYTDNYAAHYENAGDRSQPVNTSLRLAPNPSGLPATLIIPTNDFETAAGFIPIGLIETQAISGNLTADLGFASWSSLFSYTRRDSRHLQDNEMSPLEVLSSDLRFLSETVYAETVLTSNSGGRFNWLVGAAYFHDLSQTNPQLISNTRPQFGVASQSEYGQRAEAFSGFAEGTLEPIDNLFLTAGIRYSTEERTGFNEVYAPGGSVPNAVSRGRGQWDNWSPRFVVRYEFDPYNHIYASYTRGFKSGAFDSSGAAGAANAVNPEYVTAYEIGVKTRPLSNLQMNIAAYRYNYTDLQTPITISGPGFSYAILQNAADSRIQGVEFTATYSPTPDLSFDLNLSHLDTEFTSFPVANFSTANIINGLPSGNTTIVGNLTGNQLIRSPEWTVGVNAEYSIRDVFGGDISFLANLYRSSQFFVDINNRAFQPAYTLLNGSITWNSNSSDWYVRLQGRNLTSARIATQIFIQGAGDTIAYQKPANWLATIGYRF